MSAIELGNSADGVMQVDITWEYDNWRSIGLVDGFENVIGQLIGAGRSTLSTLNRFL
jgi:SH3-like domain-containing protein